MLGVHGNGLSHLLWMPATPWSAVIEMFAVGGFARDCKYRASWICLLTVSQINGRRTLWVSAISR